MGYIYCVTNKTNNTKYIGKTIRSISVRWQEHIRDSQKTERCHSPLHNAIKKYGQDNFIVEEIEVVSNSLLNEREKYWISYYDTANNGYNATIGGDGSSFKRISCEYQDVIMDYKITKSMKQTAKNMGISRRAVSDILIRFNIPKFAPNCKQKTKNKNQKAVGMYDKDTLKLLNTFESVKAAGKAINKNDSNIGKCCKGERNIAYGYVWKYL